MLALVASIFVRAGVNFEGVDLYVCAGSLGFDFDSFARRYLPRKLQW